LESERIITAIKRWFGEWSAIPAGGEDQTEKAIPTEGNFLPRAWRQFVPPPAEPSCHQDSGLVEESEAKIFPTIGATFGKFFRLKQETL
jgi:hypothetical protein